MSASSFPRPEHLALLRRKIEDWGRLRGRPVEVCERGLNQLKCQYKFGLRSGPQDDWREIGIHFQVAERLGRTGDEAELNRALDDFTKRRPVRDEA